MRAIRFALPRDVCKDRYMHRIPKALRTALCGSLTVLVAGCGGGFDVTTTTVPGETGPASTVGGIWRSRTNAGYSIQMFVAENGVMMVTDTDPSVGGGMLVLTGSNDVMGSFRLKTLSALPGQASGTERTCTIEGSATERRYLQLTLDCEFQGGGSSKGAVTMFYDRSYETASSLDVIAGNYLAFNSQTDILNVNADGVLFGMLTDSGADCTVNGRAEIIDADYSLYGFEISLSSCQGSQSARFEGASLSGLGYTTTPDGLFMLVTAVLDGRLQHFSVRYERV